MESADLESLDPLNSLHPGFGALPNIYLLQSEDSDAAEIVERWLSLYAPISHPAKTSTEVYPPSPLHIESATF
jgi:hypothetical protein